MAKVSGDKTGRGKDAGSDHIGYDDNSCGKEADLSGEV